jgi:hypothetical protein
VKIGEGTKSFGTKSVKSRQSETYDDKTVDEIEAEMDRHRANIDRNDRIINNIRKDNLKSKHQIAKETAPLRFEN